MSKPQWDIIYKLQERIGACENGKHELEVVHSDDKGGPGGGFVVRWCAVCGSIVVDHDVDGRTDPGHYGKMRSPLITKCS